MYLVNDAVKAAMDATDYKRMRLVSAGVKLFGRSELGTSGKWTSGEQIQEMDKPEGSNEIGMKKGKKLEFRVLSDGLLALLPHLDVSKLVVGGPMALRTFLESYYPLCSAFEADFKSNLEALSMPFCPVANDVLTNTNLSTG